MVLKARSKTDNSECYINSEYIVDVFVDDDKYIAYTIDDDRGGYYISEEEFKAWVNYENDTEASKSISVNFIPDDLLDDAIESDDNYDENGNQSKEYYKPMTGFQVLSQCAGKKDEG